jgi:integrase
MTFAPLPPISERAASKLELSDLTRANLLKACKNMRDEGLRRKTIASAFSAMSRLLRKLAEQDPSIVDHAHGIQVIGSPKSYKPKPRRKYRAVPADEVHHFINTYVELVAQPIFWTPAVTGAQFGELLAINWLKRNPAEQTLVLHEVVDRNGHLESGLKTTHSLAEDEERPTTTLFPEPLAAMYERNGIPSDGYLVRSVTGKFFTHRNFYRDLWGNQPGSKKEGPMTHYQRDGGRRFTPQDLRRSFSSWLGDSGIPQWIIDTWMGHSDPELETFLGNQRRGSVLMRHYIEEMGSWRPVALEVLTTVIEEGRLPTLRIVRE